MIWLTWRQARAQTLAALGALAVVAIYLVWLGLGIRNFYDTQIAGCATDDSCSTAETLFGEKYLTQVVIIGVLLIAVPAVIGVFWGAPLITRELEAGTHRLVWNQSVTRRRWLSVKIGLLALLSLAVTGVFSLLLTWAAEPFDKVIGSRFSALTFDSRDIVPLGYAVFGFVLGTTIGLLIRRTLPAMALTLALFAVTMIVMPQLIRPNLMTPETLTVAFTEEVASEVNGLGSSGGPSGGDSAPVNVHGGYSQPGAWILSSEAKPLIKADGTNFTRAGMEACMTGDFQKDMSCLATQNLHFNVTYHPASRYWPFQWIETSAFLVLAMLLAGFCFWRIPRLS
jgi:hypothetical protein